MRDDKPSIAHDEVVSQSKQWDGTADSYMAARGFIAQEEPGANG